MLPVVNGAIADELPEDTNKIESLTPEQARKLAEEFRGVVRENKGRGARAYTPSGSLPLNGLKARQDKQRRQRATTAAE
jgi:hypothetical protein